MAGIEIEKNIVLDGVDLSPLIHKNKPLEREDLFWHYPHYHGSAWTPGAAIRQGDWKLIEFYESNSVELYNLKNDLSEKEDLSLRFPEKVIELQNKLRELQKSMMANSARINPNFKK